MSTNQADIQLHLITNCPTAVPDDNYLQFIEIAANSGISDLQLRQKNWSAANLRTFGRELQSILKPTSVKLIINDNLQLAAELDVDGIHLGQQDSNPELARAVLGSTKKIGLSIESYQQLTTANRLDSIDYVAASAIFHSKSKTNLKHLWGVNGLQQFCNHSRHPVIAIGGITRENLASIATAKISGIAVISAIHEAADPAHYIGQLRTILAGESHE